MSTPTIPVKPENKTWYLVDARDYTLGRLASRVATVLRGKHKPIYSPHQDHGDHVVVVNAARVQLTGKKLEKKTYFRHTGYMGGGRLKPMSKMMAETPEEVIRKAVRGMLPKTRLGRQMIRKLKIYAGEQHPHAAQGPTPLRISDKAPVGTDA
jgi:large subunit ribosomal protein L13